MTCNECANKKECIMSAPDGHWKACDDFVPQTTTAEEKICPFNSDSEVTEYCVEGPCEHLKECPYAEELPTIPQTDSVLEDIKAEIENLPRIKVGNSNSPTVKYCIDERLIYELFDKHISRKE